MPKRWKKEKERHGKVRVKLKKREELKSSMQGL
jgi:hypothetical protein